MRNYIVRHGDSLWKVSKQLLGTGNHWKSLARLNGIQNPSKIFVGQELRIPDLPIVIVEKENVLLEEFEEIIGKDGAVLAAEETTLALSRVHVFVLADEVNPFTRKVVRKVMMPDPVQVTPGMVNKIMRPDKYGFSPRNPTTNVSLGRHVLGRVDSKFISASERAFGSPLRAGKRFWIDVNQAQKMGAKIYTIDEILKDLDRITKKTKNGDTLTYIKKIAQKSTYEKEMVFEGAIPKQAVKGVSAQMMTRSLRVVGGVGLILSARDISGAAYTSYQEGTAQPITVEMIRQASGWGAAWAGAKVGAVAGAACGISTGPYAVVAAGAGSLLFGTAAFFGADWAIDYIYGNK